MNNTFEKLIEEHSLALKTRKLIDTNWGWAQSDTMICSKCYLKLPNGQHAYYTLTTEVDDLGHYTNYVEER